MVTKLHRLLSYSVKNDLVDERDVMLYKNFLYEIFKITSEDDLNKEDVQVDYYELMEEILDEAVKLGLINDTLTERDLFEAKIMGLITRRQSEVNDKFNEEKKQSIENATSKFYKMCKANNYIQVQRIAKNISYEYNCEYGDLQITINLSKPEKDPKDIERAKFLPKVSYPKCMLCEENIGFAGNLNMPARQNLRAIELELDGTSWFFQYSPYLYFNEHSIVFNKNHIDMVIDKSCFKKLLDFIDVFPHYMIGSNADLPIVGGSILTHEHFQAGKHRFPIEDASIISEFRHDKYNCDVQIVNWPLSTVRLISDDKSGILELADVILQNWKKYNDEENEILSFTDAPHNTITPIARLNSSGKYELDLVLRNNRTTEEHKLGIFHPHANLHNIKKENIGLIEVMGLAILPGRLVTELKLIEEYLLGTKKDFVDIEIHQEWVNEIKDRCNNITTSAEMEKFLRDEVGEVFKKVLYDCGVFKQNEKGLKGFSKFIQNIRR